MRKQYKFINQEQIMNDKKFNEIMKQYVDSTPKGKDYDFQKLKIKSAEVEKDKKKKFSKYVWGLATVALIAIISLAIVLPVTLSTNKSPEDYYLNSEEVNYIVIDGNTDIENENPLSRYGLNFNMPVISAIEKGYTVINKKGSDEYIGAFIDLTVFDEHFDIINVLVLKNNYHINAEDNYMGCTSQTKWKDTDVLYMIDNLYAPDFYNVYIKFASNGYKYYISFQTYEVVDISTVLDLIY